MSSGLKTTFLVHFILALIFSLPILFAPSIYVSLMGFPAQEPLLGAYRLLGAAILAFGVSSWLAYKETAWERVKIVVQMEIVWTVLATLIFLWGLLAGPLPSLAWLNALIMAAFAVAFSLFYFRR